MLLDLKQISKNLVKSITGVLHVGAHYGEENQIYNDLEIKNRIFFEPLVSNFRVLKNHVGNWPCYNFALGDENTHADMFVESANKGQSSSLLSPALHLQQYPHIQFNTKERVEVKRLDDVDFDRSAFNLINIDVQGYELKVFKGAENTLSHIDYIISEVNRDEVYQDCTKVWELDEFLGNFGFKRSITTWDGVTWGDAFYEK